MPAALIPYYSYTDQTRAAADRIAAALTGLGWSARTARIEYATGPLEHPLRPLRTRAGELSNAAVAQAPAAITVDGSITDTDWDLVLIGSPTWNHFPAVPISSFLRTPAARHVLGGTPFGSFAVCRGFWRVNRRTVRRLGEQLGGRWVGGTGLTFDGGPARTFHSFFHDQVTGGDPARRLLGMSPTPFGLSEATLARAAAWAVHAARTVGQGMPPSTRTAAPVVVEPDASDSG